MNAKQSTVADRGVIYMAADAAVGISVVIAGLVIAVTRWLWVAPAMSLVVAGVIAVGTWGLLRESIDLALDAVPRGVSPEAVETYFLKLPSVSEVHDLHIWRMSTTEAALTAHRIKPVLADEDAFLAGVCKDLHALFGIEHATLQIERGHGPTPCGLASAEVV